MAQDLEADLSVRPVGVGLVDEPGCAWWQVADLRWQVADVQWSFCSGTGLASRRIGATVASQRIGATVASHNIGAISGRWQVANGKWQVADERLHVANEMWQVANGEC